jgi:RHS repeat-associated protein
MNYKSIMSFVLASVIMVTSLTLSPQSAVAANGQDPTAGKVADNSNYPLAEKAEKLENLSLVIKPTGIAPQAEVIVVGNVKSVPSEYPVSIVDSETFEILKTCTVLVDCTFVIDTTAHNKIHAQSAAIRAVSVSTSKNSETTEALPSSKSDKKLAVKSPKVPSSKMPKSYVVDSNQEAPLAEPLADQQSVSMNTGWGIDLQIDNPLFGSDEKTYITADANQDPSSTIYGIYVFDITNNTLSFLQHGSFRAGGEITWRGGDKTRSYQAYVSEWTDTAPTKVEELINIQAESGVVTAEREAWTISLAAINPVFEAANQDVEYEKKPYATFAVNQDYYFSNYSIYMVNDSTGGIFYRSPWGASSLTGLAEVYFRSGDPLNVTAYVAPTDNTASTITALNNIEAVSNTITFTRKAWAMDISIVNPVFEPTYYNSNHDMKPIVTVIPDQETYYSDYETYLIRTDTGSIVRSTNYGNLVVDVDWKAQEKSRTYVAYIARRDTTLSNVSQLTEIQAISSPVTATRKDWTLSVGYTTRKDAYSSYYIATLGFEPNQDITWAGYNYVMHNATDNTWWTIPYYHTSSEIYLPQNTSNYVVAYVGTPKKDENNSIIGVTDIQAMSNTLLVTHGGAVGTDGVPTSELYGGSNPSANCTQACAGDPINTVTGEFWEQNVDVTLTNVGLPLQFVRAYGVLTANKNDNNMGYGWTNNYNMKLRNAEDLSTTNLQDQQSIQITQENGSTVTFVKTPSGEYVAPSRVLASLTYSSLTDSFVMERSGGAKFTFSSINGNVLSQTDAYNNRLLISYDSSNRISKITGDNGKFIELTYSSGNISRVTDSSGYYVGYVYDNNDNLISVEDNQGVLKQYTYDSAHKVLTMVGATGETTFNVYYGNKLIKQTDPEGNEIAFEYVINPNSTDGSSTTLITYADGSQVQQSYANFGQLVKEIKGYGSLNPLAWTYVYNSTGNITAVYQPDGSSRSLYYDFAGNLKISIDENGRQLFYSGYNEHGAPSKSSDAYGNATYMFYNATGALTSVKDAEGHTTVIEPNSNGTIASTLSPLGYKTSYVYDAENNIASAIDDANSLMAFSYDASGNVTQAKDVDGNITSSAYDTRGNVTTVTDENNNVTTTTYDNNSRPIAVKDTLGNISELKYDLNGNLLKSINAEGSATTYIYDNLNQVISVTDSLGSIIEYKYDIYGHMVLSRDALGNETAYEYDWRGNVLKVTSPEGLITRNIYGADGKLKESYDAADNKTSYTYGVTPAANLATVTDAVGNVTSYVYNKNGQLTSVTKPDGTTESWVFDPDGRTTSHTDSASKTATYDYNNINQLIASNIAGVATGYTYNLAGQVSSKIAADSSTTGYAYDNRGQLTNISYSDLLTPAIEYKYDALGRKTSMVDGTGVTTYTYDKLSRLLTETKGSDTTSYAYNALLETSITYPSGEVASYGYDALNRLQSVKSSSLANPIKYSYDKDSRIASTDYGNGVTGVNSYATNGAIGKINYSSASSALLTYAYTYNSLNLVTNKAVTREAITVNDGYEYDSLSRLGNKNAVAAYSFDNSNNILTRDNGTQLTYNALSQITSLADTVDSSTTNYAYDTRGNRVSASLDLASTTTSDNTYGYNLANQLVEAQLAANPPPENTVEAGIATDLTYSYDGNGLLSGKTKVNGSTGSSDSYVWNTNTSIAQLLEDDKYNYIYGLGSTPLAQVDKTTSNVEYLHGDSIGSVSLVTDSVGLEVAQYTYDDYGVQTAGELGHVTTRFGYAGQYLDEDTGYYYMRARWYDPVTAQFITVDPALAKTNLPYGYTVGNPLSYTDPLGLSSETLAFLNGAAGFMNGMSGGLYEAYLGAVAPGVIDICSSVYQVGNVAGSVAGLVVPGAAGVKIAGLIVKASAGLFKTAKVAGKAKFPTILNAMLSKRETVYIHGKTKTKINANIYAQFNSQQARFGEAALHNGDALQGKKILVQRLSSADASINRSESLKGIPTKKGFDRDESPPASISAGGVGASVRYINPSDNRRHGRALLQFYTDNQIKVGDWFIYK